MLCYVKAQLDLNSFLSIFHKYFGCYWHLQQLRDFTNSLEMLVRSDPSPLHRQQPSRRTLNESVENKVSQIHFLNKGQDFCYTASASRKKKIIWNGGGKKQRQEMLELSCTFQWWHQWGAAQYVTVCFVQSCSQTGQWRHNCSRDKGALSHRSHRNGLKC